MTLPVGKNLNLIDPREGPFARKKFLGRIRRVRNPRLGGIMVWIAERTISAAELHEVAKELGISRPDGLVPFACFVAEKCAAIADLEFAKGGIDAGRAIRSAIELLCAGHEPATLVVDGSACRVLDLG